MLALAAPRATNVSLRVPGDKSITHRALLLAAIARGRTTIVGPNTGDDVVATVLALRKLGVTIRSLSQGYEVVGASNMHNPSQKIDCGNSGTTMRLLAGLLAGRVTATLDGDVSLRRRPMERVAEPLRRMGAILQTRRGLPPIKIRTIATRLHAITWRLPVASAQVKSAILLAALRADGPSSVVEPMRTRNHTEIMLRTMGARLRISGKTIRITPGPLDALGRMRIPGDFSSAFYLLSAAAMTPNSKIEIRDVGINPTRRAALEVVRKMGAAITLKRQRTWHGEAVANIVVRGGAPLHNVTVAPHLVPLLIDEIPALCALAATARGTFRVAGASELKVKESNRIRTTVELVERFGGNARALSDGIIIRGVERLRSPSYVRTHGDHRIGLAAAILVASARTEVEVRDTECIGTSFPGFDQVWGTLSGDRRVRKNS